MGPCVFRYACTCALCVCVCVCVAGRTSLCACISRLIPRRTRLSVQGAQRSVRVHLSGHWCQPLPLPAALCSPTRDRWPYLHSAYNHTLHRVTTWERQRRTHGHPDPSPTHTRARLRICALTSTCLHMRTHTPAGVGVLHASLLATHTTSCDMKTRYAMGHTSLLVWGSYLRVFSYVIASASILVIASLLPTETLHHTTSGAVRYLRVCVPSLPIPYLTLLPLPGGCQVSPLREGPPVWPRV